MLLVTLDLRTLHYRHMDVSFFIDVHSHIICSILFKKQFLFLFFKRIFSTSTKNTKGMIILCAFASLEMILFYCLIVVSSLEYVNDNNKDNDRGLTLRNSKKKIEI